MAAMTPDPVRDAAVGAHPPNPLTALSLEDLRTRTSVKWRAYPPDVLPLWVAEMDVPVAAPVAAAVRSALDHGDTGYAAGTAYAEALSEFSARRWGWSIDVARTATVADVMRGVTEMVRLVTRPGDDVVVSSPVYPPFYAFMRGEGRTVVEAPLDPAGRLDPDALADAFERATRGGRAAAYLLCNPHNPTGTVHAPEELAALAALAARHGVRVISDEIHAPLTLPGATFTPYLTVPGTDDAFAVMSASKGWNLAGFKAAVVIAGADAVRDLRRMPEVVGHGVGHLGSMAHAAAYRDGEAWLDALLAGLDANRRLLGRLLEEHLPRVRHRTPAATYLAWLDCRELGEDPARGFLDEARVALLPGEPFGTGGEGRVRLNFATSPAILTEAVRRMGEVSRRRHG